MAALPPMAACWHCILPRSADRMALSSPTLPFNPDPPGRMPAASSALFSSTSSSFVPYPELRLYSWPAVGPGRLAVKGRPCTRWYRLKRWSPLAPPVDSRAGSVGRCRLAALQAGSQNPPAVSSSPCFIFQPQSRRLLQPAGGVWARKHAQHASQQALSPAPGR